MESQHLVPLPGGRWSVMSPAAVRTTGLPAGLLTELSPAAGMDPTAAASFDAELARTTRSLAATARLDRFREALAWQNPSALTMVDSLAREAGEGKRDKTRRAREYRVQRYVARYAGKTETIGFFGPLGWGTITPGPGHLRQRPGPAMISRRRTFAEPWSVRAIVAALAADDTIRPWLPLRLRTHYCLRDGALHRPRHAPQPLAELELAILLSCDGVQPRCTVSQTVAGRLGVDRAEVERCVDELIRRRFLLADANLPLGPECLAVLEARLAAIGDPVVQAAARALTTPYLDALVALSTAHGDADRVAAAQAHLATVFEETTRQPATRRGGRMYAGRGLAYEECLRDLTVELGEDFLARIGPSLAPILTICQWLTWETRAAYEEYFARLWGDGRDDRYLDEVWFDLVAAFFGSRPKPIDVVLGELRDRWGQLVEQCRRASGGWEFTAEEFQRGAEKLFSSPGPGWPHAALHSPDLQLAAHRAGGTETGDYTVVLGEIHIAAHTIGGPVFEWPFDGYAISRTIQAWLGTGVMPLFPDTWPRNTGRTMTSFPLPGDTGYAFADTQGAPAGTISIADIRLRADGGTVTALLPDGTRVGFGDFFAVFLTGVTIDAWKSVMTGTYTPRISVGGMVIARQSWRVDVSAEPFALLTAEHAAFLAVHEWRGRLGMPDRVYVKLGDEVKPFYTDFRSPISVLSFLAALRASLRRSAQFATIGVSEAFPAPEHAWVVDADGQRYLGELRLVLTNRT